MRLRMWLLACLEVGLERGENAVYILFRLSLRRGDLVGNTILFGPIEGEGTEHIVEQQCVTKNLCYRESNSFEMVQLQWIAGVFW